MSLIHTKGDIIWVVKKGGKWNIAYFSIYLSVNCKKIISKQVDNSNIVESGRFVKFHNTWNTSITHIILNKKFKKNQKRNLESLMHDLDTK